MTLKLKSHALTLATFVMAAALCACSPSPTATPARPDPSGAEVTLPDDVATVMGKLVENDWYVVIRAEAKVKPLVIWTASQSECNSAANEFNLKAVDSTRMKAPVAWCTKGRDLRAHLTAL